MDVIGQCFPIASSRMCGQWQSNADLVLEPNVSAFAYDAFKDVNELVKVGEEAARAALPQIRAWITDPTTAEVAEEVVAERKPSATLVPSTIPVTT
jgi:hypothetical protein